MEAIRYSEISVDFYQKQLTRHYNPEVRTVHSQHCENSKSNSVFLLNFAVFYFVHKPIIYSNEYYGLWFKNSDHLTSPVPRLSSLVSLSSPELTFLWPSAGWTVRLNHLVTRQLIMKLRGRVQNETLQVRLNLAAVQYRAHRTHNELQYQLHCVVRGYWCETGELSKLL